MAPSKQVRIALTFDDGPHTASKAAVNYTLMIDKVLTDRKIKAAFFIQAQTPIRMGNRIGMDIIRTLYTSGHSIQIHTGSKEDHALYYNRVSQNAYDINGDKKIDELDGYNGLQSDMKYAKKAIAEVIRQTKGNPEYVPLYARATTGAFYPLKATHDKAAALRKQILETLAKEGLSNVLWTIDSGDNSDPHPTPSGVMENIDSDVKESLRSKERDYLIALFHDINPTTAESIDSYINGLTESIRKLGREPIYASSRQEVDSILDSYKTKAT